MKKHTQQALAQMSFYEVCELAIEDSKSAWDYLCLVVWRRAEKLALGHHLAFGLAAEDAKDAAQSTVELFVRKGRALLKKSKANGLTGAWLHKFVRDAVISFFRKSKKHQCVSRLYHLREDPALPEKCEELETTELYGQRFQKPRTIRDECEAMESIVVARNLRQAMVKTDDEAQIVDALSAGMTYRQMAEVFNISLHAVHQKVQKLRGRAQRHLQQDHACLEFAA